MQVDTITKKDIVRRPKSSLSLNLLKDCMSEMELEKLIQKYLKIKKERFDRKYCKNF